MTGRARDLLGRLADGELHSGVDLARALGTSRAAVSKIAFGLRERGVPVESLPRRGYRLPGPVELLDRRRLLEAAVAAGRPLPDTVEVLFEVDSTNTYLHDAAAPPVGAPRLVFAEIQHAGRGRRGRTWLAPFGSGLTFSVAWTFEETPPGLSALGLALGVAAAESLTAAGLDSVRLKWPNDVVWNGRKLGGLLLQLRVEAGGAASVVAGLGLNLELPTAVREQLRAAGAVPVTDLAEALGNALPGRNALGAGLASALLAAFDSFGRAGYPAFAARWAAFDALAGRVVRVEQGDAVLEGVAQGTDADGSLRVLIDGCVHRFHSGDVSLRAADP